jgi:hypothetical protein
VKRHATSLSTLARLRHGKENQRRLRSDTARRRGHTLRGQKRTEKYEKISLSLAKESAHVFDRLWRFPRVRRGASRADSCGCHFLPATRTTGELCAARSETSAPRTHQQFGYRSGECPANGPPDEVLQNAVKLSRNTGRFGRLRCEAVNGIPSESASPPRSVAASHTRSCQMMLKCSSIEGGSKYAVMASNSASVVHAVPAGSPLLRSLS